MMVLAILLSTRITAMAQDRVQTVRQMSEEEIAAINSRPLTRMDIREIESQIHTTNVSLFRLREDTDALVVALNASADHQRWAAVVCTLLAFIGGVITGAAIRSKKSPA